MRHHNVNRKFGRETNQRRALIRSLAKNLILNGKITTTEAKAKEIRPFVEKLITTGKAGTLTARRLLISKLAVNEEKKPVAGSPIVKIMDELAPKYKERAGGYIRIVKKAARKTDGSPMAIIEFV